MVCIWNHMKQKKDNGNSWERDHWRLHCSETTRKSTVSNRSLYLLLYLFVYFIEEIHVLNVGQTKLIDNVTKSESLWRNGLPTCYMLLVGKKVIINI